MSQTFSIAEPCQEAWEQMTPNVQGRHCAQCCKTVVDFSSWNTEEITAYLYTQRIGRVCGRMREEQVAETRLSPAAYIYQLVHSGMDFMKKVAAILLFAVCIGEAAQAQAPIQQADTLKPMIMGKMIAPPRHPEKPRKPIVKQKEKTHITGMVAPLPNRTPEEKAKRADKK